MGRWLRLREGWMMMVIHRWARVLGAACILALCAGCSTTAKHTWTSEPFPGVARYHVEEDKHVSLVFLHGMGGFSTPTGADAPDPRPAIDFIAEASGLRVADPVRIDFAEPTDRWRGWIQHWALHDADGQVAMDAYALHWKPTNEQLLAALKQADKVKPLERMRPAGTRKLKDGMTDRLGDVALYAGSYRPAIQDTVTAGLMTIDARAPEGHVIVPVTWSLGSRILYDTVRRILREGDPDAQAMVGRVPLVFMLANQIQFLALAGVPAEDGPREAEAAPLFAELAALRTEGEIHVVGVTDPSDLLSWPLPPSEEGSRLRLVNAYHSTASTALLVPGFGEVGNPLAAHTDYGGNAQVLRWILYGSAGSSFCRHDHRPGY